jgi:hypothetical protein
MNHIIKLNLSYIRVKIKIIHKLKQYGVSRRFIIDPVVVKIEFNSCC